MDEKKRWSDKDPTIYRCEACNSWHYFTSKIGEKHIKFMIKRDENNITKEK